MIVASILGGVTSAVTGGKFANGAITAAFSRAFNDEAAGHSENTAMETYWDRFLKNLDDTHRIIGIIPSMDLAGVPISSALITSGPFANATQSLTMFNFVGRYLTGGGLEFSVLNNAGVAGAARYTTFTAIEAATSAGASTAFNFIFAVSVSVSEVGVVIGSAFNAINFYGKPARLHFSDSIDTTIKTIDNFKQLPSLLGY